MRAAPTSNIVFSNNDVYAPAHDGVFIWGKNQIDADIMNNKFYMTADHPVYVNKDAGATQIIQSDNVRYDPSAYAGDKID